jgi:hypothetical protein
MKLETPTGPGRTPSVRRRSGASVHQTSSKKSGHRHGRGQIEPLADPSCNLGTRQCAAVTGCLPAGQHRPVRQQAVAAPVGQLVDGRPYTTHFTDDDQVELTRGYSAARRPAPARAAGSGQPRASANARCCQSWTPAGSWLRSPAPPTLAGAAARLVRWWRNGAAPLADGPLAPRTTGFEAPGSVTAVEATKVVGVGFMFGGIRQIQVKKYRPLRAIARLRRSRPMWGAPAGLRGQHHPA